ncbi:hypothetical protein M409DRAFT_56379 [Zasmidium cellare ATCC 36951]|uniref:Xylanolytic transcriptional activator regulatory domain-containing protein n=1 Tax=Zasmidium cellare ATCC 36951 TaxID=1080233 RepID=A0A6A6CFU6_ZASCE|nr:uncharacterized protein M409DRAFT_56379 [Zasmidium cellare ATCC 36951]KAF2164539.1 hypothetical protein M409DRAFT_56379 [Zasmidium cellare ATCC 36951]
MASTLSQDEILSFLPEKGHMDVWTAAWLDSRHQTRIIVHRPTFQLQYYTFWDAPPEVDDAWLALLMCMASMGALLTGHTNESRKDLEAAEFLRRLAAHVLIRANVSVVRPYLIEALLVYGITSMYTHRDILPEMWHLTSFITRLCFQAGLNREVPNSVDPGFSPFTIEMRRRVWMTARDLDISTSSISGNPSSIDFRLCDTHPPANLTDVDFSPMHMSPVRPKEECTLVQIQICYSRVIEVLGKATTLSHSVTLPCRETIERLGIELQNIRGEIPEHLLVKPLEEYSLNPPSDIMYRFRLEFAFQRTKCVLYQRFMGGRLDMKSVECINAAEAIVQCCNALPKIVNSGHQWARFKLFSTRHIHDFLLAAMLLCSVMKRKSPKKPERTLVGRSLISVCAGWLSTGLLSNRLKLAVEAILRYLASGYPEQSHPTPTSQDMNVTGPSFDVCSCGIPANFASADSSFKFDTSGRDGFVFDVIANHTGGIGSLLR